MQATVVLVSIYTFLSDVIARDEFYRREGIFIIWVFASFDRSRAAVTDEAFFNRRNLFVLDAEAMSQTMARGILTLNGYRQVPQMVDGQIADIWTAALVGLNDVTFPSDNLRPYFFDYEAAHKEAKSARVDLWQNSRKMICNRGSRTSFLGTHVAVFSRFLPILPVFDAR